MTIASLSISLRDANKKGPVRESKAFAVVKRIRQDPIFEHHALPPSRCRRRHLRRRQLRRRPPLLRAPPPAAHPAPRALRASCPARRRPARRAAARFPAAGGRSQRSGRAPRAPSTPAHDGSGTREVRSARAISTPWHATSVHLSPPSHASHLSTTPPRQRLPAHLAPPACLGFPRQRSLPRRGATPRRRRVVATEEKQQQHQRCVSRRDAGGGRRGARDGAKSQQEGRVVSTAWKRMVRVLGLFSDAFRCSRYVDRCRRHVDRIRRANARAHHTLKRCTCARTYPAAAAAPTPAAAAAARRPRRRRRRRGPRRRRERGAWPRVARERAAPKTGRGGCARFPADEQAGFDELGLQAFRRAPLRPHSRTPSRARRRQYQSVQAAQVNTIRREVIWLDPRSRERNLLVLAAVVDQCAREVKEVAKQCVLRLGRLLARRRYVASAYSPIARSYSPIARSQTPSMAV